MQDFSLQFPAEIDLISADKIAKPKDASFYISIASLAVTVMTLPSECVSLNRPGFED